MCRKLLILALSKIGHNANIGDSGMTLGNCSPLPSTEAVGMMREASPLIPSLTQIQEQEKGKLKTMVSSTFP